MSRIGIIQGRLSPRPPPRPPGRGAVHLEDRSIGGPSCLLGQGEADFSGFFRALARVGRDGDFVLQTWFGDDPVRDAFRHLNFVRMALARAQKAVA